MSKLKSALNKSALQKLHDFSNLIVKKLVKMTELQLISKLRESEPQPPPTTITSVRVKAPKRILHFSDGILEEYSSDDEIDGPSNQNHEVKLQIQCHPLQFRISSVLCSTCCTAICYVTHTTQ